MCKGNDMRPASHKFDEQTIRYYRALKRVTKFLNRHLFLIIATIAVWNYINFGFSSWSGAYADADGYMRALRIKHWLLSPSFFEQPIYESNYPFGEILHWTRPMDILWLFVSLPFWHLGLGLKDTIFISGAFIAPILGVLSTIALAYGLRRRFNIWLVIIGCLLFMTNSDVSGIFNPAYADHHALLVLLMIYSLSLTLCWLKKRQNRYLRLMGLSLALASFTVIDGVLAYALFLSFFLYLYLSKNISLLPAVKMSKYFAICLTIFWFINPPFEGWLFVDNSRISIVYVITAWLIFAGLTILDFAHLHTFRLKIMSLICITLSVALLLIVIFGVNIFHFPIDKEILEILINRINEDRSFNSYVLSGQIAYWTQPFVALLLTIYLMFYKPYQRIMVLNLIIGLPLFILSLFTIRFLTYASYVYEILPFLCLIDFLYQNSAYAKNKNLSFPIYIWAIIIVIFCLQQVLLIAHSDWLNQHPRLSTFSPQLCQKIRSTGGTLVTDIFRSPRMVYECDVNTVGTCYHNNKEGIIDNHRLLYSERNAEVFSLFLKHQVTQILLFDSYDTPYYPLDDSHKNTLYYRLIKHERIPPFLEYVPTDLPHAHLYKIKIND